MDAFLDHNYAVLLVLLAIIAERLLAMAVNYKILRTSPPPNLVTETRLREFREEQDKLLALKLELLAIRMNNMEQANTHVLRILYRLAEKNDVSIE